MGGAPINNFYTVCGAIPIQLITEVIEYAKTQEYVRTNHTSWREGVVGHSGAIYLITVDGALKEKVHTALAHAFPDFNLLSYDISVTYTLGGRYSFIPWHDDGIHKLAVTLYLNEYWDKDWAGLFAIPRWYRNKSSVSRI